MRINNVDVRIFLGKILKQSEFLLFIYNSWYRIINKRTYFKAVKQRESLSVFDYDALSQPLPFYPIEPMKDSNYYGQYYWIKRYAGVSKSKFALEHGLYYGNYLPYFSRLKTTKAIMTYSHFRENVIKKALPEMNVVPIGPYIHYAATLLSEAQIAQIKKQYGRILLFFPHHSIVSKTQHCDIDTTINKIKQLASEKGFDSVFVNMYYLDIIKNHQYVDLYESAGFHIVTAGHIYDFNFLARLKSIISLSDYTVSNRVGTHTGYSVYLHKPHFILDYDFTTDNPTIKENICDIKQHFLVYHDQITSDQYDVINKYWGMDCIKSKEELYELLS